MCLSLCALFLLLFFPSNLAGWRPLPAICCMALHHNPCVQAAPLLCILNVSAGCSTLQSAEITRQSLHQCVGLASCCCREAAADFRSRCLTSRITSPTMPVGRNNSGGGRMLFTCRFLLSHLRQATPAPSSPTPPLSAQIWSGCRSDPEPAVCLAGGPPARMR